MPFMIPEFFAKSWIGLENCVKILCLDVLKWSEAVVGLYKPSGFHTTPCFLVCIESWRSKL
jgi:hypothetical protein